MLSLRPALVSAFLAVAAAQPLVFRSSNTSSMPAQPTSNVTLLPVRAPGVNGQNMTNLVADSAFVMHYSSNPDPSVDSVIGTVSASGASYPIVQLKNSDFIKSVECTDNSATISFNSTAAYQTALADWQGHDQFLLLTSSPSCGAGYARGQREYALVSGIKPNNASMSIQAGLQFVDYPTAIGNDTLVTVKLDNYQAPMSKRTSVNSNLHWTLYPTNTLSTNQFGTGYQLYQSSELDVICAGCGTDGYLKFTGEVDLTFSGGFKSASASLSGSMAVNLGLGILMNNLAGDIKMPAINFPPLSLPAFDIPGVAQFGPAITVSAEAEVDLDANGWVQLDTLLNWPNIDISVGLESGSMNQATGLLPTSMPTFQSSGSISATLDLSLPISVGVDINILDGEFTRSLAIVDTPSFSLTGEEGTPGATSCNGIGLSAGFENDIDVNLLGLTTIPIASTSIPLFTTCLATAPPATTATASFVGFGPEKRRGLTH